MQRIAHVTDTATVGYLAQSAAIALKRHGDARLVVLESFTLLARVGKRQAGAKGFADAGGWTNFVAALTVHGRDIDIAFWSGLAVRNTVSSFREAAPLIVAAGGCKAGLAVLAAHRGCARVVSSCCGALSILCVSEEGLAAVLREDGPAVLVAALRGIPSGDILTARYAVLALVRLCKSDDGALAVFRAGGVAPLVAVVRIHAHYAPTASLASMALGRLADINGAVNSIVDAGGVSAIVACLRLHDSEFGSAFSFCSALGDMAVPGGPIAHLAAAGAAEAVVAALHVHCAAAELAHACCKALVGMLSEPEGAAAVCAAGGVAAFVTALRASGRRNEYVAKFSCSALARLLLQDPDGLGPARLTASGGAEALVAALSDRPDDPSVATWCSDALMMCCMSDEYVPPVLAAGGAAALVGALRRNFHDETAAKRGCRALAFLSARAGGAAAICAAGGEEALRVALGAHRGDVTVEEFAQEALGYVAEVAAFERE